MKGIRPAAIIVAMLAAPSTAMAQGAGTLYVDGESRGGACSDSRTAAAAADPASPLCTIPRGVSLAAPGARVVVRGGGYPELGVSGQRSDFVTVAAQAGETVTLPRIVVREGASHVRFEGLTLAGGETFLVQERAHHVQLLRSSLSGAGPEKIDLQAGASDVLIEGNRITGGGNGITFNSESRRPNVPDPNGADDPPIRNVVVRGNAFDDIGTDAIRPANFDGLLIEGNDFTGVEEDGDHSDVLQSVWGGDRLTFRNNYVHDFAGQGLFLKDGQVTDVTVENNVFVGNRGTAFTINVYDTIGFRLLNNTIWDNRNNVTVRSNVTGAVILNNLIERLDQSGSVPAGTVQDHNLIGGGTWRARGPHDIGGAPTFVSPAAQDYRLAAGSPGIDAGTSDGTPTRDKACRPRHDVAATPNRGSGAAPYYDIGALEHGPLSTPGDTAAGGCGGSGAPTPAAPGPGAPATGGCACAGGGAGGTSTVPPAGVAGPALVGAAAAARPRVTVRRARLRGRRLVLTLRVRRACRVRVAGRARWKHGDRVRRAPVKAVGRRVRRSPATVTLRRRVAKRVRAALRHPRRVGLRLTVRATGCAGETRVIRRRARLRR